MQQNEHYRIFNILFQTGLHVIVNFFDIFRKLFCMKILLFCHYYLSWITELIDVLTSSPYPSTVKVFCYKAYSKWCYNAKMDHFHTCFSYSFFNVLNGFNWCLEICYKFYSCSFGVIFHHIQIFIIYAFSWPLFKFPSMNF